jgi:hypothetical protein
VRFGRTRARVRTWFRLTRGLRTRFSLKRPASRGDWAVPRGRPCPSIAGQGRFLSVGRGSPHATTAHGAASGSRQGDVWTNDAPGTSRPCLTGSHRPRNLGAALLGWFDARDQHRWRRHRLHGQGPVRWATGIGLRPTGVRSRDRGVPDRHDRSEPQTALVAFLGASVRAGLNFWSHAHPDGQSGRT